MFQDSQWPAYDLEVSSTVLYVPELPDDLLMTWSSQCSRMARWPGVLHVPEWPDDLFVTWSPPCSRMARWPMAWRCLPLSSMFQNKPNDLLMTWSSPCSRMAKWPAYGLDMSSTVLHVPEWPVWLWGVVQSLYPDVWMTYLWPDITYILHIPWLLIDLIMTWWCHPYLSMSQKGLWPIYIWPDRVIHILVYSIMPGWPSFDLMVSTLYPEFSSFVDQMT